MEILRRYAPQNDGFEGNLIKLMYFGNPLVALPVTGGCAIIHYYNLISVARRTVPLAHGRLPPKQHLQRAVER